MTDEYLKWQIRVYGRGAGGGVTRRRPSSATVKRIRKIQMGRCLYCKLAIGSRVKRNGKTVALTAQWDHFVPYSYLAQNPDANWVLSCQICNGIKSDRMFETVEEARAVILQVRDGKGYEPIAETIAKQKQIKARGRKAPAKTKPKAKPKTKVRVKPQPRSKATPPKIPTPRVPIVRLPAGAVTHGCGAWWTGNRRSHCPRCCQTFASEQVASLHRVGNDGERRCLQPEEIGLIPISQPWGTCWGKPKSSTVSQLRELIRALDIPPQSRLASTEQCGQPGETQEHAAEDPWWPTRPEKAHRRPGGLTPEQRALTDDLHARALAIRAARRGRISIREAVELAAIQLDLSGGIARAIKAQEQPGRPTPQPDPVRPPDDDSETRKRHP